MLKIIKNLADAYKAANESVENWARDKVPDPIDGAKESAETGYGIYEKLSEAEKHRENGEHEKEGEAAGEAAADMLDHHPLNWFDPTGKVMDPLKEKIVETGKIIGGRHDYIEDIVDGATGNSDPDKTSKKGDPTEPYRPRPDESPTQGYKKQYYDPIILDLDGNGVGTVSKFGVLFMMSGGAMFDHDGDGIATQAKWVAVNDEWWEMVV